MRIANIVVKQILNIKTSYSLGCSEFQLELFYKYFIFLFYKSNFEVLLKKPFIMMKRGISFATFTI